ncbi:unnamed protein product [Meloidogyne enterolobii]|uniref:Uncharacterized protein n=1 Tax=Meloidogyne enterolobii TaxID=390850 RepID=A0ACB0ZRC3_MELEN
MTDQQKLLIILQPNNVERKERTLLNAPINIRFYGACIACTVIDVILIFLTLLAYFYPNPFRRTPLYKQIFQKLDRFTIQFWYSITLLALTIFFFLHFLSVGGSLLSIQVKKGKESRRRSEQSEVSEIGRAGNRNFKNCRKSEGKKLGNQNSDPPLKERNRKLFKKNISLKKIRKPLIFIPQLILCLLAVLLQLLLFSVCITISIVSDDTMWGIAIFSLFLLFLFGIYLAISVFTFKQLLFECDDFKKMLANSKSVHFKEENKRKK